MNRDLVPQDPREGPQKIRVEHVIELCGEFNPGWSSTTDHEREEPSALFIRRGRETGQLEIGQHLVLDQTGIINCLQEIAVLEPFDTVGVSCGPNTDHELIIR